MKKITLFTCCLLFSIFSFAQSTCTQTFSESGTDDGPTVLTINAADLTCSGSDTPTALTLVNPAGSLNSGFCTTDGSSWYGFQLSIDGGAPLQGCGSDFDNIDITGFTSLTITSQDDDAWSDSITMTIDVEVTFTASSTPNCDATLVETSDVSVAGNISWSEATGAPNAYDLTVGTTSGGSEVLATTDVGDVTSYDLGLLDFSTTYYVTIVPKNDNGAATGCVEQTFVTKDAPALPTVDVVFDINACGDSDTYNVAYDVNAQPFVWVQLNYVGGCTSVTVDTEGGDFDTEIGLYDSNGFLVDNDDDGGSGTLSSITTENLTAGTYYIVAGTYNTIFGAEDFDVSTTNTTRTGTIFVNASTPSNETADFNNLQFPFEATIFQGNTADVYAQVYEPGITDSEGQGAGIEVWIGVSDTDATTPADFETADWTWIEATYNTDNGNNDEYQAAIGAGLNPGTFYYVSRFSVLGGPFTYGGINPGGSDGNTWDGTSFVSGVLTVESSPGNDCDNTIVIESLPYNTSDDTVNYSNFFDNGDSSCSPFYLSGNDVVYTYTPSADAVLDFGLSALSATWSGIHVLDSCPTDAEANCVGFAGNSTSADRLIEAVNVSADVTYYIIISTWGPPDTVGYTLDISESCLAEAGTLTADASPVSLVGGTATISATEDAAPVVPTDYDVTYVLTSGETLVIEAVNATPSFDVTEAGDYTIHTLVAETTDDTDPNYLDLSVVEFGVTTGGDVLGIVTGAGLCAALDVTGAPITVLEECTADAGTLTADASPVSLVGGTATISATEDAAPVVPTDYDVTYVLTSGETLVIEAVNATPSFDVTEAGDYTIHTLVAETTDDTDPNYLDLSVVEFGVTTGGDVLGIVTGAGLCAALDVTGAPITVLEECTADAGTLTADASPVSLVDGTATISATPNGDIVVPADYDVIYVLTSGPTLIIEAVSATPSFDVTEVGDYTIHTLVAETTDDTDPNYLDLSVVEFGVTTGVDVLGIVTDAGLCAALDVTGAPITVDDELGLNENAFANIKFYPNPVKDELVLSNSRNIFIETVDVFDLSGRAVKHISVNNNSAQLNFSFSELNSGMYILILNSEFGQFEKQIIKE